VSENKTVSEGIDEFGPWSKERVEAAEDVRAITDEMIRDYPDVRGVFEGLISRRLDLETAKGQLSKVLVAVLIYGEANGGEAGELLLRSAGGRRVPGANLPRAEDGPRRRLNSQPSWHLFWYIADFEPSNGKEPHRRK